MKALPGHLFASFYESVYFFKVINPSRGAGEQGTSCEKGDSGQTQPKYRKLKVSLTGGG